MSIWFLILIAIIAFAFITFIRKWHDYAMLFSIAIGFAVNANIYNSVSNPVYFHNIIFAVDSILYTGFTFTVLICAKEYSVVKAKILTSSAIAAILISAMIEFFAEMSSNGYDFELVKNLLSYFFSALGTFFGIWVMLYIFEKLDRINIYIVFSICVLVSSIINSTIYYSYYLVVADDRSNIGYILLGSYIGKLLSIELGLISYYINKHYWIPNDLKEKNISEG